MMTEQELNHELVELTIRHKSNSAINDMLKYCDAQKNVEGAADCVTKEMPEMLRELETAHAQQEEYNRQMSTPWGSVNLHDARKHAAKAAEYLNLAQLSLELAQENQDSGLAGPHKRHATKFAVLAYGRVCDVGNLLHDAGDGLISHRQHLAFDQLKERSKRLILCPTN